MGGIRRRTALQDIEGFMKRSHTSATAFGYLACGDPAFVRKLRQGRVPREKTIEKVRNFMNRGKAWE